MSVREEDKQKSSCSGRGLGLAAAAIGVGVGAALYYFLSKRPENPDTEGATSAGWYEQQQTLHHRESDSDNYTTVSENSTVSDTSITDFISCHCHNCHNSSTDSYDTSVDKSDSSFEEDFQSSDWNNSMESNTSNNSETNDLMDWDVTSNSLGVPTVDLTSSPVMNSFLGNIYGSLGSPILGPSDRNRPEHQPNTVSRDSMNFRKRAWSLEQCSVCFEVMLQDQQLMSLPCTHNFHVGCIGPWLEQQQTCPVCRKPVE